MTPSFFVSLRPLQLASKATDSVNISVRVDSEIVTYNDGRELLADKKPLEVHVRHCEITRNTLMHGWMY